MRAYFKLQSTVLSRSNLPSITPLSSQYFFSTASILLLNYSRRVQSEDDSSDMNSSYSICPDLSSSISSINFSMSIVISNWFLIISMRRFASMKPSLFGSPPSATNASSVSSSLLAPWNFFYSAITFLNWSFDICPVLSGLASAIMR